MADIGDVVKHQGSDTMLVLPQATFHFPWFPRIKEFTPEPPNHYEQMIIDARRAVDNSSFDEKKKSQIHLLIDDIAHTYSVYDQDRWGG